MNARWHAGLLLLALALSAAGTPRRVVPHPRQYGGRLWRRMERGRIAQEHYIMPPAGRRRALAIVTELDTTRKADAAAVTSASNLTDPRIDAFAAQFAHWSYLESPCAASLADGARWMQPAQVYVLDADNPFGVARSTWRVLLETTVARWQDALGGLFVFFGGISESVTQSADGLSLSAPNNENAFVIAPIDSPTAVGVAVVWVDGQEIIEADIALSPDFDYDFSADASGQSPQRLCAACIIQHEWGHALGMDHPSGAECTQQTMWASVDPATDTQLLTLANGDICGVRELYGAQSCSEPPPAPSGSSETGVLTMGGFGNAAAAHAPQRAYVLMLNVFVLLAVLACRGNIESNY